MCGIDTALWKMAIQASVHVCRALECWKAIFQFSLVFRIFNVNLSLSPLHSITKHLISPTNPSANPFKERESLEWEIKMRWMEFILKQKRALVAVCYGNQLCSVNNDNNLCEIEKEPNASLSKFNCRLMNYLIKCLVSSFHHEREKNFCELLFMTHGQSNFSFCVRASEKFFTAA